MTTPNVPVPSGAIEASEWYFSQDEPARRTFRGVDREIEQRGDFTDVLDSKLTLCIDATQYEDGRIDPTIAFVVDNTQTGIRLDSDQTSNLIRVLKEALDQMDRWGTGTTSA